MKQEKVTSESYVHEFTKISPSEITFVRTQNYKVNNTEIDCYGNFWSFIYSDIPAPGIQINFGSDKFILSGKQGMLLPKHSLIEWKFLAPQITWYAYSTTLPYPSHFPDSISIYALDKSDAHLSLDFINNLIQTQPVAIQLKRININPYAEKLKSIIDSSFSNNLDLGLCAKELNISKEWLIKYFKKSYNITPISYRNKKRLMEAFMRLHLNSEKVLDLSHQVGFNDLKQFNTLFKDNIRTQPSKFIK